MTATGESPSSSAAEETSGCSSIFIYMAAALASLLLLAMCVGAFGLYFFQDEIDAMMGEPTIAAATTPATTPAATRTPAPTNSGNAPATAAIRTLPPTAAALATEEAGGGGATATPGLLPTLAPTNTRRAQQVTAAPRNPITLLVYTSCTEGSIAEFPRNAQIMFEWNWEGTLEPGEFLEVRVGRRGSANLGGVGGQVDPNLRNGSRYRWPVAASLFFIDGVAEYEWQVAYVGADGRPKTVSALGCIHVN